MRIEFEPRSTLRSLAIVLFLLPLLCQAEPIAAAGCTLRVQRPPARGGWLQFSLDAGQVIHEPVRDVQQVIHGGGNPIEIRLRLPGRAQEQKWLLRAGDHQPENGSFASGAFLVGRRCLDASPKDLAARLRRESKPADYAVLMMRRDFGNLTAASVAKELASAGYTSLETMAALKMKLAATPDKIAVIGRLQRYSAFHVATSLKDVHRLPASSTALAMHRAKYGLSDIVRGLKQVYRIDRGVAERGLASLSQPAATLSRALDEAYGPMPGAAGPGGNDGVARITSVRRGFQTSGASFSAGAHFPLVKGRRNEVTLVGDSLSAVSAIAGLPTGYQARVVGKNATSVRLEIRVPANAPTGKLYRVDVRAGTKFVGKLNFRISDS